VQKQDSYEFDNEEIESSKKDEMTASEKFQDEAVDDDDDEENIYSEDNASIPSSA
jgi:hypothetical protein